MMLATMAPSLTSCSSRGALRVAAHPWPGYSLLYLADSLDMMNNSLVQMIETPTATANIRALGSGIIEASCLTLDEVLTARERDIPLTVVGILNVSHGADTVLAMPNIDKNKSLKGLRIGVEYTATGAIMLAGFLEHFDLKPDDLSIIYVRIDEHEQACDRQEIDLLVTYEPVKSRLLAKGLIEFFSSAKLPSTIVDVLAVRTNVLASHRNAVKEALSAHFRGLHAWQSEPDKHVDFLAGFLRLSKSAVKQAFSEIELVSLDDNKRWFSGQTPRIFESISTIRNKMLANDLLKRVPDNSDVIDGSFLDITL